MHKTRLLAGALALLIGAGLAQARQLTVAEALSAAGITSTRTQAPGVAASGIPTATLTLSQNGLNTVYVVDRGQGFMVLAADDVAPAVLGYSDSGTFDPNNIPPNMQAWLDDYSAYIATAAAAGTRVVAAPADPSLTDIAPLTRTRWNQGAPYYDLCPTVNGQRTYTGCVATAIAQVLKTYEHPTTGTGSNSYTWNDQTLSFDFGATTFKWDKMTDIYNSASTTEECQAVAELMYACGIACYMNYGTGGSGANGVNLSVGLIRYLGYDASLQYLSRDYFTLPVWSRMLHDELTKGHPLYYDGANGSIGHAFVIDGYRSSDGFFHVNWGWGGMSDGYYSIITLDPDAQGIGGSTEGYYLGQSAIFGLKPAEEGSQLALQFVAEDILPEETSAARSEDEAIYIGGGANSAFYNTTLGTVEAELGMELTAPGLETQYVFYPESIELPYGHGITGIPLITADIPVGTFTGRPVARCQGQVVPFLIPVGQTRTFTVVSTEANVTFTPNMTEKAELELVELKSLTPCFRGKTCFVEATVHNAGAEYYGTLNAYFINTKGNSTALGAAVVDILPDGTATISTKGALPAMTPLGQCYLRLTDNEGHIIGQDVPVTLEKAPEGTPNPSIRSVSFPGATGSGTDTDPYMVNASDLRFNADLYVGGGFFTSDVRAYIFEDGYGSLFLQAPYVACWGTNTQTLNFSGDLSDYLSANTLYAVGFLYRNGNQFTFIENAPSPQFKINSSSGIEEITAGSDFAVFPNPATSAVTLTAPEAIGSAEVFDLAGSLRLHDQFGNNEGRVGMDVAGLSAGNYLLRITTTNGQVRTLRLIKK